MQPTNAHDIDALIADLPGSSRQLLEAIGAMERGGEGDRAMDALFRAVSRRPTFELRKALSERCLDRGDPHICLEHMSIALLDCSDDGEAHLLMARAHLALGDRASTLESIEAASRHGIDPGRLMDLRRGLTTASDTDTSEDLSPDARTHVHVVDDEIELSVGDSTRPLKKNRVTSEMKALSREEPQDISRPIQLLPRRTSEASPRENRQIPVAPAGSRPTARIDLPIPGHPAPKKPLAPAPPKPPSGVEEASPFEPTGLITTDRIRKVMDEVAPFEPTRRLDPSRVSAKLSRRSRESASHPQQWEDENARGATELHRGLSSSDEDDEIDVLATMIHGRAAEHDADEYTEALLTPDSSNLERKPTDPRIQGDVEHIVAGEVDRARELRSLPPSPHERDAKEGSIREWTRSLDASRILEMSRVIRVAAVAQLEEATPARLVWIFGVLAMTLMAFSLVALLVVSHWQTTRIEHFLSQATLVEATDVYPDYITALTRLEEARDHRLLAEPVDAFVFDKLPSFFVGRVNSQRKLAEARHLLLQAYIEARFEHAGSREVAAKIEAAPIRVETEAARVYKHLALEEVEDARRIANQAWEHFGAHRALVEALLETMLASGTTDGTDEFAQYLRPLAQDNTRLRFLLLRLDQTAASTGAHEGMRELIQNQSTDHVGARLALAEAMLDDPLQHAQARVMFESILKTLSTRASPLELARTHHGIGRLALADDERTTAEDQFIRAVRIVPLRGSLYSPLVEMYSQGGRLEDARRLLTRVPMVTPRSNYFVLTLAELFLWSGMPERALEMLQSERLPASEAAWLRGWAYLEMNRLEEAATAFHTAQESGEAPVAEGLAQHVRALQNPGRIRVALAELEDLAAEHEDEPMIALALARTYHLGISLTSDWTQYRDYLTRSRRAIERSLVATDNHPLLLYAQCETEFLGGAHEQAREICQRAMRVNSEYVPGLLVFARLRLDEDRAGEALRLLERVHQNHPDNPAVSLLLARAAMEAGHSDQARREINRWAGTPTEATVDWIILEGRQAFLRQDYARAIGYFQLANKDYPASGEASLFYAQTLQHLDRAEQAEPILRSLRQHPRWGRSARSALRNR
ncbi:MAG: tetratricopeptide repeat protein [Bradymonadaceae bacterium]